MESVQSVFFELLWLAVLLSATTHHVRGDAASDLQGAFDQLSRTERRAFGRLGAHFLETLKNVANCIQRETEPVDLCNFNTSFDPFYYIQKCAHGTVLQTFLEKFVRSIPPLQLPFGIPSRVSKDRCDRVPQLILGVGMDFWKKSSGPGVY